MGRRYYATLRVRASVPEGTPALPPHVPQPNRFGMVL